MKSYKHSKLIPFLIIYLISYYTGFAQIKSSEESEIDKTFSSVNNPDLPGVAAGIIKDGEIIYLKGFGSANMETGTPITPQTKFQLGELSKQFTTLAILLLEQQGVITLQEDIRNYLPELPEYPYHVTVGHLLNHSSGLYDVARLNDMINGPGNVLNQAEALELITSQKNLSFEPGTDFSFHEAITESVLMAEIVARKSEMSFSKFVKTEIFEPLGMNNSLIRDDRDAIIENVAAPYQKEEEQYKKAEVLSNVVGAINAYSSAEDLAKWYLNYSKPNGTLGRLIQQLDTPVKLTNGKIFSYYWGKMAIGREFTHPERGLPIFWNFGLQGGYGTNVFRYLDQNIISFALGNNSEYNGSLAMMAIDPFVKDFYTIPTTIDINKLKTKKLSEKKLKAFEGYYWFQHAGYASHIFVENDTLRSKWMFSQRAAPLYTLTDNSFQMVGSNEDVRLFTFKKEANDMILHFTYNDADADIMKPYVPVQLSEQSLKNYVGTYYNEEYATLFSFTIEDKKLIAKNLAHTGIEFRSVSKDVFTSPTMFIPSIEFIREVGKITGFKVNADGIHNFIFEKIN
ncbi:MAG: serine hydrolase domain-containing protein [Ekhidna sp.]